MSTKTAVVTGGTKGIGKAIIERFMQEGFDVIACARNAKDLEKLTADMESSGHAGKLYTQATDMSKKEEVDRFIDFVHNKTNAPDVVVNNAGVFIPGAIHSEDEGNLELMINTNLYSAYHLTRGLISGMMAKKSGDIFNICSVASAMAYANGGSYSISKFAMYGMSKGLREEMKPHGVRVTAVLPGATLTASWDGIDLPADRFIKPEDVANAVWSAHCMSPNTVIEDIVIRPQLGDI